MKTILVTGGAGFIGSNFVRHALGATGARLVNLDRLTYAGSLESLRDVLDDPRHVFVEGDIADGKLVLRLLEQYECDAVINFAAESHVDRSIGSPASFVQTNVVGTFQLLEASLAYWKGLAEKEQRQFRFLHVSTDEVYGSLGDDGRFQESTAYSPNSPYSASKASSDHFVRAYFHTYHLPTLITNCSNNYGPYQFPEKLIPLTILNALEGKPLPVYGQGENVRDWLHVSDHCRALVRVLEAGQPGEVYNIGGNCERANIDVVRMVCQAVDSLEPELTHRPCDGLIEFVTDRPGHDFRYAVDAGKIERELGWTPQIDFAEGLHQTVAWYRDHRDWVEQVCADKYDRRRLGLERSTYTPDGSAQAASVAASDGRAAATSEDPFAAEPCESIPGVLLRPLSQHRDSRGWLTELFRHDELDAEVHPAMAYVSQTEPGVARGPHEHVDQTDYFAFVGPGDFRLYLWDARRDSPSYGKRLVRDVGQSNPHAVVIPPGVVHAYQNVSDEPGWVFNAPNRLYAGEGKRDPVDEIRHEDKPGSPYRLDQVEQASR
jgi:dTDP-glucose 4,6-dehydratase